MNVVGVLGEWPLRQLNKYNIIHTLFRFYLQCHMVYLVFLCDVWRLQTTVFARNIIVVIYHYFWYKCFCCVPTAADSCWVLTYLHRYALCMRVSCQQILRQYQIFGYYFTRNIIICLLLNLFFLLIEV